MKKIYNEWNEWKESYKCAFCNSSEHTVYPVMRGEYKDHNIFACSTCDNRIWRGEELNLKSLFLRR